MPLQRAILQPSPFHSSISNIRTLSGINAALRRRFLSIPRTEAWNKF